MVPWGYENQNTAARNKVVDFANRLGRRGGGILTIARAFYVWASCVWDSTLTPQEQEASGIQNIVIAAAACSGKLVAQVELTEERLNHVKAHCPSGFERGAMDEEGYVRYSGEMPGELIDKMRLDGINVPPEKDFTPANRKRLGKMNMAREAVLQRLVETGVLPKRAASDAIWLPPDCADLDEAEAEAVLNDPQKWNDLSNRVRADIEAMDPIRFRVHFRVTKEEALGRRGGRLPEGGGPTPGPQSVVGASAL